MELSITLTEFILLCWAIIATGYALRYSRDFKQTRHVLTVFIENEDARNQVIAAHAEFMKEVEARRARR